MVRALANWWDSVELWITQSPFPLQVLLAIVALLPLCAGVALVADRVSDLVDALLGRIRAGRSHRPDA